jgi:pimeloyl-ACP methyl ester carboxylesterase/DNA-binding CsgD family transcriptional regulator
VPTADQEIRFCDVDGARVAVATVGSGPPLVLPAWWTSHVEVDWRGARFRAFVQALARDHTVIRYDRLGTGLSDRDIDTREVTLDTEVRTLDAVVQSVSADAVDLWGMSCGGSLAIAYAASRPERVDRMVLYGTYALGTQLGPQAVRESMLGVVRAHWGLGARMLAELFLPEGDADARLAFADVQRAAATPAAAADLLDLVYRLDVRAYLTEVSAPTVVVHRRDDRAVQFPNGVEVASRIPGARFVALDGRSHLAWEGDPRPLVETTLAFLGRAPAGAAPLASDGDGPGSGEQLSAREREILRLVARGLNDRQIAETLVLSPHTVHRHVANIRHKLGQPTRTAAVNEAARLQLI